MHHGRAWFTVVGSVLSAAVWCNAGAARVALSSAWVWPEVGLAVHGSGNIKLVRTFDSAAHPRGVPDKAASCFQRWQQQLSSATVHMCV
jgi:hypothetical protein